MKKILNKILEFIRPYIIVRYHYKLVKIYKNASGNWHAKFQVRGTSHVVDKKLCDIVSDDKLICNFPPIEIVRLCFEAQEDIKEPKYYIINKEYHMGKNKQDVVHLKIKGERSHNIYPVDEILDNKEILDNISREDLLYLGIKMQMRRESYIQNAKKRLLGSKEKTQERN